MKNYAKANNSILKILRINPMGSIAIEGIEQISTFEIHIKKIWFRNDIWL